MLNADDTILIYRYGNVYRAKVSALSSLYSFYSEVEQLSSQTAQYFEALEDSIDSLTTVFDDEHYTKAEQRDRFALKEEAENLTANEAYVLSSNVKSIINPLISEKQVDEWLSAQTNSCFEILKEAYREAIDYTYQSSEDTNEIGGATILPDEWEEKTQDPTGDVYSEDESSLKNALDKNFGVE